MVARYPQPIKLKKDTTLTFKIRQDWQENKMDIGILNSLGYIEVIEITIWLAVMYYGKCWVDNKFK